MGKKESPERSQLLNRNLSEMLEGYPQNLAAVTDEITKSFKIQVLGDDLERRFGEEATCRRSTSK